MASKYITTQQYEPLRAPSNWNTEERKLVQQLTDRLDDLYGRFNRLRFEDLGNSMKSRFETIEGYSTSIEQNAQQITLKASQNDVAAAVNNIKVGGTNLLSNSAIEKAGTNEYLLYADLVSVFDASGIGEYVFSFELKGAVAGNIDLYYTDRASENIKYKYTPGRVTFNATTAYVRYTIPVVIESLTPSGTYCSLAFYGTYGTGRIPSVRNVKIEKGNKATDWSPSPSDPAPGVKTSYIQILSDALQLVTGGALTAEGATFDIATDLFTIQNFAKTLTMLEVANGRVGGSIAVFTHTISDVPNTFVGGTIPWAGSFQASLNNIGKWLLSESTITISGNITEDVTIPVFIGSRLNIKLAAGTKFTGHITFSNCANVRMYADAQNTTNIIGTGTDYVVKLDSSHVVMENLHISGKVRSNADDGTLYAIIVTNASTLTAKGCTTDRTKSMSILGDSNSKIDIYQCKGGVSGGDYTTLANAGWGIYVQRNADVSLYDTCPFGVSGGVGTWIGEIRGTATNTPTDGTTPAAPSVKSYAVSAGYAVKTTTDGSASVSWGSGEPRQGSWWEYTSGYEIEYYNGFGLLLLAGASSIVGDRPAGKTITAATFKLRRDATVGASGTITCTLHQHGLSSSPSGAPNSVLFAQAADPVALAPNQECTITLNASAIANLNSGACKGFGFKNTGGSARYDVYGELAVTYS